MAKEVALTVNVADEQFQQFTRNFDEFVKKVYGLNDKWLKMTTEIYEISESIEVSASSAQKFSSSLKGIHTRVSDITKHIYKWGALISGIVTMLGAGTLFGMSRMSETVMQRQRQMMGVGGGDYGRTLAAQTLGKSVLDDPNAALDAIGHAKADQNSPQNRFLRTTMGFSKEEIESMPADELLARSLMKLPDVVHRNVTSMGQIGPRFGPLGGIETFGEKTLMRAFAPGGKELFQKEGKAMLDAAIALTPAQKKAWQDFWDQIKSFTRTIETEWVKAATPLAGAMTEVSAALTELIKSLVQTPEFKQAMNDISKSLQDFATYLKSDETQKAMRDFIDDIRTIVKFLSMTPKELWDYLTGRADENTRKAEEDTSAPRVPDSPDAPALRGGPKTDLERAIENADKKNAPPTETPQPQGPAIPPEWSPGSFPATGLRGSPSVNFGGMPGGAPLVFPENQPWPEQQGAVPFAKWGHAASRGMRGFGRGTPLTPPPAAPQEPEQKQGALDMDNWQSSRTASLVVRGVPSANLFLAANGMA